MNVAILGVPMDLGAGRRGVDMGPSALRCAGLVETLRGLGHDVRDLGNVHVPDGESFHPAPHGRDPQPPSGMRFLEAIRDACQEACDRLADLDADVFPVSIGGDHSMSMGTFPGARHGLRTGLIWVDAHTDFNVPETSPSGNIHGMPVAHLVGLGDGQLSTIGGPGPKLLPEDIVMIGIRSVDTHERRLLREQGATVYTMKEVDRMGIAGVAEAAMAKLSHLPRVHLSFDADSLDPTLAPGVGTPVPGGLTYREAHLLMELFSDWGKVTSLDLVEVNPILDHVNATARTMVEMAGSLLGKRIL